MIKLIISHSQGLYTPVEIRQTNSFWYKSKKLCVRKGNFRFVVRQMRVQKLL